MEKPPVDFAFINISEPKQGKNVDLRKLVRSNAMRSYRRKQEQKAVHAHTQKGFCTGPPRDKDRPRWLPDAPEKLEPSQLSQPCNVDDDWSEDRDISLFEARRLLLPYPRLLMREEKDNDDDASEWPELTLSSSMLVGYGLSDPFDAYPIGGSPRYISHIFNHFVSVMTKNCLPIDPEIGQNPLTKVWVPYAMTDPVLFLATLNFAAAHLDMLRGTYNNPTTLVHKGATIRGINARLQSSIGAISNTTIGAVAMLAAMESISGNCQNLRIHMNALAQMVKLRGGLQGLGWSGVLHMFISWQDLISSAVMVSRPHFPRTPCSLVIEGDLPYSKISQINTYIDNTAKLCAEMAIIFQKMRYLANSLGFGDRSTTLNDSMSFSKQRSTLEHRLLSLKIRKPKAEMRSLDLVLEACRISALIFVKCVFYQFKPVCAILQDLKQQLLDLGAESEGSILEDIGPLRRGTMTWILFMGGILSLNSAEEELFAERIAHSMRHPAVKSWADMEMWLKDIAWVDSLRTPECISLWNRALSIAGKAPGGLRWVRSQSIAASPVNNIRWLGVLLGYQLLPLTHEWNAKEVLHNSGLAGYEPGLLITDNATACYTCQCPT